MEIPRHWRLNAHRYRLAGSTCPACNHHLFPPRPVCPDCTQRIQSTGADFPIILASIDLTGIELHIRYEISERKIM